MPAPRGCNDESVIVHLHPRHLVAATVLSLSALSSGCGRDSSTTATTVEQRAATEAMGTNPFIPDDVNIGDCVSSMPRPGCGNEIRGDSHSMLTFGALVAGLTFIGWRIVRGTRRGRGRRDLVDDAPTESKPTG